MNPEAKNYSAQTQLANFNLSVPHWNIRLFVSVIYWISLSWMHPGRWIQIMDWEILLWKVASWHVPLLTIHRTCFHPFIPQIFLGCLQPYEVLGIKQQQNDILYSREDSKILRAGAGDGDSFLWVLREASVMRSVTFELRPEERVDNCRYLGAEHSGQIVSKECQRGLKQVRSQKCGAGADHGGPCRPF